MKILSIDTASDICGVSILDNNNLICNLDSNTGRTHSENLMPFIDLAFKKSNICLKDIDLLVCDKGPGSFTGIRIGIATVMAFKDSLNIPAIGINSLEVLANNISTKGLICSIIDCKNSNCYFALYDLKDEYIELISPKADTIENLCLILKKYYFDYILPKKQEMQNGCQKMGKTNCPHRRSIIKQPSKTSTADSVQLFGNGAKSGSEIPETPSRPLRNHTR